MKQLRSLLPILLLLLVAFLLRTHQLTEIPPGLTHDEANHGREGISILAGNLALFFPLNYGSEPLYSYTVAAHMALLGRGLFALRLVNVFFGLLAIAATYLWGKIVFGRPTAWLAAALMALTFWPLASSREALRAGMMPFFTAGAVFFFWLMLRTVRSDSRLQSNRWLILGFTLCLAATLYNYLAARVVWLLFPAFLLYLALLHRPLFRRSWRPALIGLVLAGLSTIPMFLYLERHPEAQTRLQMFGGTMQRFFAGDVVPLLQNAGEALLAFIWPGVGDKFLAYNIPGRPVFDIASALFFVVGVVVCLWRWRRPAYAFLLLWFLVGVTPSLITGPTANTTRNVGAMPAAVLLPAVGFITLLRMAAARWPQARTVGAVLAGVWLIFAGWVASYDYFVRWAQSPDVRSAYQHTLVEQLTWLNQNRPEEPVVISSVYPGAPHNPSIALVLADRPQQLRWVDARQGMLIPAQEALLLVPAATPLHPAFEPLVEPLQTFQLREDDLNPTYTLARLHAPPVAQAQSRPVSFGQGQPALTLLESRWLNETVQPGEVAELLTVWRVDDPSGVGPLQPAIEGTDVVLFTHVLDSSGQILVQQDRIDAPSWDWQAGDTVVQIHQLWLPPETAPGEYQSMVGVYDRDSGQRLPLLAGEETRAEVDPLRIIP